MHAHLARNMCENLMAIVELYPKHRVRQRFRDRALYFDHVFFGHEPLSFLPRHDQPESPFTVGLKSSRAQWAESQ